MPALREVGHNMMRRLPVSDIRLILPALPIIAGGLALLGWLWDIDFLKRGMVASVAMNPATAICFILAGLETIRSLARNNTSSISHAGQLAIALVIVVSALKLSDLLLGTSFGIDTQLFAAKLAAEPGQPNKMAPNTAFCFFVLGLSVQLLRGRSNVSVLAAQLLALVAAIPALLAIAGYIYGVKSLIVVGVFIPMAINTAASFIFLSISVLLTHADKGFMFVFAKGARTRAISTVLLPAALLVPLVFGWISLAGQRAGLYDISFALALSVILNITALLLLIYVSVRRQFLSDSHQMKTETKLRDSEERSNELAVANESLQKEIRERMRMEGELRESEIKYRQLFEGSSDGLFLQDATGVFVDCNENGALMYGLTKADLIGYSPAAFTPERQPDGRLSVEIASERFAAALSGYPQKFELKNKRADGVVFDAEIALNRININGATCLHVVVRDISVRRQVDELMSRYKQVIDTSLDGFWMVDNQGYLLEANDAYASMSGYSIDELNGMHISQLDALEKPEDVEVRIKKVIRQGHDRFETQHRRKDGSVMDVEIATTYLAEKQQFVVFSHDITKRKQAEETIKSLAFYDPLTKLPNRRLFYDRLEQAMSASNRSHHHGAVLFLDLDNFKPINDTHGHEVGDLLLIEVARRISSCIREMDTAARFGGDEFVVLLSKLDTVEAESIAQAGIVAEKIRTMLGEPYILTVQQDREMKCTVEHHCTSSIGAMLFISHEYVADDILRFADVAMYQAKESGRNQIQFFEPKIRKL